MKKRLSQTAALQPPCTAEKLRAAGLHSRCLQAIRQTGLPTCMYELALGKNLKESVGVCVCVCVCVCMCVCVWMCLEFDRYMFTEM